MDNRDELLAILDIEASIIELCCLKNAAGRDFYVYIKVAPSKYEEFKAAQREGELVLSSFGEALCFGEGKYPPPHIQQEMEGLYGVRHDLESCITNARPT